MLPRAIPVRRTCTLVEAHTSRHLERHEHGDDRRVGRELVDHNLVGFSTEPASGCETIEVRKESRAIPPLLLMERTQGLQGVDGGRASQSSMQSPSCRQARRSSTDLSTEL